MLRHVLLPVKRVAGPKTHTLTTTQNFRGTTAGGSDLKIYFYPVSCQDFLGRCLNRGSTPVGIRGKGFVSRGNGFVT